LAGLQTGFWSSLHDITDNRLVDRRFTFKMKRAEASKLYKGWKRAVAAARKF
jgi:glycerol kinase